MGVDRTENVWKHCVPSQQDFQHSLQLCLKTAGRLYCSRGLFFSPPLENMSWDVDVPDYFTNPPRKHVREVMVQRDALSLLVHRLNLASDRWNTGMFLERNLWGLWLLMSETLYFSFFIFWNGKVHCFFSNQTILDKSVTTSEASLLQPVTLWKVQYVCFWVLCCGTSV